MNEDFRYIAAIAEYGSISKAARAMRISQPALSQRLKRLETQLGIELFDRAASPLAPTAPGKVFIDYAQKAIAAESTMRRDVRSASAKRRQRLRIGVSMPRADALLAQPIISYYESHRGCSLELRELSTLAHLHDLFIGNEIDFAVLTPIAPDPSAYYTEVLCRERLLVVASKRLKAPQFDSARNGKIGLGQLEGVPFALPSCGDYFDPMISRIIDVFGVQLHVVVRDCSAQLALSLVGDGLCVALMPSTWVHGKTGFRTYELSDIQAGNVLRYVRPLQHTPSEEEALFLRILRNWLNS